MAVPALEVRGVSKRFDGAPILRDVDLTVAQGEFISLLGPSGCGKSTLLRLIAGFEAPDAGDILVDGRSMAGVLPYDRPLTMMFQSLALFPHMRVAENVGFGLRARGLRRQDVLARAGEALALVGLEAMGTRRVQDLSGGQRQRVALARCLVIRPLLLLLDEPLGALDLKLRHQLQIELKRIQRQTGCGFVFVTHDQDEAMAMSDRIAVMNAGRLEQIGTPAEIYHRPHTAFAATFIGETNMLPGSLIARAGLLAIRPERMRISMPGAAAEGELALHGQVQSCVQIGPMLRYMVDTPHGPMQVAELADPHHAPYSPQTQVVLRCHHADMHAIEGTRP